MGATANVESPLESIAWYAWESDESESNWLLTYVDMLSVVLAMLVVLLGHMAVQHLQVPEESIEPVTSVESVEVIEVTEPVEQPEEISIQTLQAEAIPTPESRLITAIETQFQGEIKVAEKDFGISLEIADVILFESGKADFLSGAGPVLMRLAMTLQEIGEANIAVEGHTDNRPILGGRFQSNWELAAARANAVTRFLLSQGFAPERLRSVSYADTHPVADNQTAEGRAENRRVNLRVDFL
ncbi:MAG: OmpA family protein [Candidatus Thiodiazotropha sp. (ex Myrtea sp. 'scaly one' KF741663)]|nr:OmpA family protein [Candidatus Thiodiazotropha sp. (ex Myrtea sp. 'scaly one' KF741663)]